MPVNAMRSLLVPFKRIADALSRMSARERTLAAIFAASLLGLLFFIGGYLIYSKLDALEERNAAMRQALRDLESKRSAYLQARAKIASLDTRIGSTPLQLDGFLEQVAKDTGLKIREMNPGTPEPIGKKYVRQSVDIRLGKVGLEQLVKFLRKMEQNPTNLVMVTQLSVRSRDDKHVDFDVEMTVSTFEHAPKKDKGKAEGGDKPSPKEPS